MSKVKAWIKETLQVARWLAWGGLAVGPHPVGTMLWPCSATCVPFQCWVHQFQHLNHVVHLLQLLCHFLLFFRQHEPLVHTFGCITIATIAFGMLRTLGCCPPSPAVPPPLLSSFALACWPRLPAVSTCLLLPMHAASSLACCNHLPCYRPWPAATSSAAVFPSPAVLAVPPSLLSPPCLLQRGHSTWVSWQGHGRSTMRAHSISGFSFDMALTVAAQSLDAQNHQEATPHFSPTCPVLAAYTQ